MGCVPSFLFDSNEFKDIPFYNESFSKNSGITVSLHQNMEAFTYQTISPKMVTSFRNRQSRMKKAFPSPLHDLIFLFESIESGIPRVKAVSDKSKIESSGRGKLTYLKMPHWDKTLTEEINARALKKADFQELEIWNFIYFLVCSLTRLEQKKFAIDRVSFDDVLIVKKKFKYFYRPLYSQKKILKTTSEGKIHNKHNFPELFKQFKALLLFIGLMVVPLDKILTIFDMDNSKEIFTKLHEILWVKYYPRDAKSTILISRSQRKKQTISFKIRKCRYVQK